MLSLPPLHPLSPHPLWYPTLSTPPPTSEHPHRPTPPPQTPLSALQADEATIHNRKAHIRRLGAGWLRPPGISKTLQGLADERAEREEGELLRAREAAMADAQAEVALADVEMDMLPEEDLDADVPVADDGGWSDEDGMGLEGAEQEVEVDLDAEVPVAEEEEEEEEEEEGSYEHTDTEAEDESLDGRAVFAEAGNGNGGVLGRSVFGVGRGEGREN